MFNLLSSVVNVVADTAKIVVAPIEVVASVAEAVVKPVTASY